MAQIPPQFVGVSGSAITPPIVLTGAAVGTALVETQVTGDTNPRVSINGGNITFGTGAAAPDTTLSRQAIGVLQTSGKLVVGGAGSGALDVQTTGFGLQVAEGANAKQGIATLVAGTVTVANTNVTASSRIFCTTQILGTVTSASTFDTPRTAGTSFTIHASQATDTSTVAWEIFEPG